MERIRLIRFYMKKKKKKPLNPWFRGRENVGQLELLPLPEKIDLINREEHAEFHQINE
jgi:hypothetical protein